MMKRGKNGMLQFMKEPAPFAALLRHRVGCRSLGKLLCAMVAAWVLAAPISSAAAGRGEMDHTGSFAGDTGNNTVLFYRPAVGAHAPGVRNGSGDRLSSRTYAAMGQSQPQTHLRRSIPGGTNGQGIASDPVSGLSLELTRAYEAGSFNCAGSEKSEREYGESNHGHHRVAAFPRCLHVGVDNESRSANIEVIGRLTLASAQNKPVERKISIKPRYSRRLCKFYAEGRFEKLQGYIQRKWKGLYTLEDIYLSLRCEQYHNRDLARVVGHIDSYRGAVSSSFELEKYFRKIAGRSGGDSLLAKVLYCEEDYFSFSGRYDFFDYLEYHIRRSQDREESPFYINKLFQLRKVMSAHVRDFPFPALRLELGPGEAREYRRKWCREHLRLTP